MQCQLRASNDPVNFHATNFVICEQLSEHNQSSCLEVLIASSYLNETGQLSDERKSDTSNFQDRSQMNAYQLPFNPGGAAASPFNYFPQNGNHSYGVAISPPYASPRPAGINHTHKSMSPLSTFVPPSNYFHPQQSHLQPFTSFSNSVQTSNGPSPYSHSQYNAYASSSGSPPNASSTSSVQQNNFDYSLGYNSANLTNSSAYPCLSSGSNSYSPYSSQHLSSAASAAAALSSSNTVNSIPCTNSSSTSAVPYQTVYQHADSYLNLSGIKVEPCDDSYNLSKVDGQIPPTKKAKKSGRGRGRRNLNPSPLPENNIDRIFVWYIDETALVYLTMAECNRFSQFSEAPALCNEIFMFINKFANKYLFLDDLKDIDQSHIDDSVADDNGQDISNYNFSSDGFKSSVSCNMGSTRNSAELRQKMALRYRKINEIFSNYSEKLNELLEKPDQDQLSDLLKRFDLYSKNWLHSAGKALSFIKTRPNCMNILISSSPLIYTLSKVLLFGLSPYFSIGNIYSCAKTSKEHTLNRVLSRFGTNCTYIVVGKNPEVQQLSLKLGLPFWPVIEKDHFEFLLNATHHYF